MLTSNLFGGILCLTLGLLVQTGKVNFLMAGYNTMSKEEQAKWDANALSKFLGWVMLIVPSLILLIACIPIFLGFFPSVMYNASWIIFATVLIGGIIYMNFSSRFKCEK